MSPEATYGKGPEIIASPDQTPEYRLTGVGSVAVFGDEGAGKSNLANSLALLLGAELFEGGKTMRQQSGGTSGTIGYLERDESTDRNLDRTQIDKMTKASPENPLVNESRLSGFLATQTMNENPDVRIVRINITAPTRIRASRIRKRAIEEWETKKEELISDFLQEKMGLEEFERCGDILAEEKNELTIDKIKQKEKDRRVRDISRWTQVWPQLDGRDPLNPGTRINGQRLYDITASTGKRTKAETLAFIIQLLVEKGYIEKIPNNSPADIEEPISPRPNVTSLTNLKMTAERLDSI